MLSLLWGHPYITSAHFCTFSDPPAQLVSQHVYSAKCQQKLPFSEPNQFFYRVLIINLKRHCQKIEQHSPLY